MPLRLVTLGELALRRDHGDPLAGAMRKPLLVLAVLAANGPGGTPREQLLALLWPAAAPA